MTERLAAVEARIEGINQLGAVVNAMRGIAAARVQQARNQLAAVDRYASAIAAAIQQALALIPAPHPDVKRRSTRIALVLFCAEQGFAGAFSERILQAVGPDLLLCELFIVGTRGSAAMAEHNARVSWKGAMPSHSLGIPKLADRIVDALYARIATGQIDGLDAVFTQWTPGQGVHVERRHLFPLDTTALDPPAGINPPLLNLTPSRLLADLTADYLHAQLCEAALHAFAAENEARMQTMAAAGNQITRQLTALQTTQRLVRQEDITEEIIELAAGETASRLNQD
ncbi:F0F1 ATP synthase subunit gamma [Acidisoma sp. L85]|uniref:F0F1 ATP synthase subunit gamma n=1 Tax=Acidisoma sp. L85 TaxID=1641850 RepID=UPI00131B48CC|nr:FoF1 ATP synthase subunit gamma [Acidisoma sp. L85]